MYLRVTLADPATSTVSVTATLTSASATTAVDFKAWSAPKVLTFSPGQTAKSVSISVVADLVVEADETATVTLSNSSSGLNLGTHFVGTATIMNDDTNGLGLQASVGSASMDESDSGSVRAVKAHVTLTAPATTSVSVTATLAPGTATAGTVSPSDYKAWSAPKVLTFKVGQTTKTLSISVLPDATYEADETATITLAAPSLGLSLAAMNVGTITIVNDDAVTISPTCPTANFDDLSASSGAGAGYAKPSISVTCTATQLKVASNGMISYTFVPITPNSLTAQSWNWAVPLLPSVAASSTSISNWFGTVGFSTTGLPIYAAMEGAQPAAEAFGDPIYNGIVDSCKGHTGPAGEYHLHAINVATTCGFDASPIVGYALDGFPIYGPNGCLDLDCTQVVTFTSGWAQTGNPKTNAWLNYSYTESSTVTVLDKCNGRIGPDGTYRYYTTTAFPYTFGCFKGTPTIQTGSAAAAMPAMAS